MKNRLFVFLRSMPRLTAVAIILFLSSGAVFAQKDLGDASELKPFLLLEKPGTKHRIRYYIGDEIEFKRKDEKHFQTGKIVQFSDTSFYVNDFDEIPLRTVDVILDRDKAKFAHSIAAKAFIAIPVFFVFSAANNIFNDDGGPIISPEVYTLSAVFGGIGVLGILYKGKHYRLKNRWRIIMVRL